MSSNIIGDLHNATKALNAHRFGVTTAGTNIANVNNPDYARQRATLGDRGTLNTLVGPRGLGVEVVGFSHMRDAVLDKEILRESSLNSSLEAQQAALAKAESSIGQEINRSGDSPFVDGAASGTGNGGMAEAISNFFNAFHSLSANPASDAEKEALVQKADILTQKFNVTAERFSDLQQDMSFQVETDIAEANQLIEHIARLNSEIARAEANHAGQALDLRDQRQARLEDLSELIQFTTTNIPNSGGQIRVQVPNENGSELVDLVEHARFRRIAFDNSDLSNPTFTISDADNTKISIRGGSVHGALEARDGPIQQYVSSLDALASEFVTQVNALYNSGSPPGNTNFFNDTGAALQRTAAGISLDATLDSTSLRTTNAAAQEQGDNTLALAIAELDETKHASLGNRTFSSFYRAQVSDLGQSVSSVKSRLQDEGAVFKLLQAQQDSVSGVSIDEEMADMIKFQRAYEATGRLIRSIDEMLDVIINRLF